VLITHKLREALSVADDVTVLRHGRVTHSGRAHDSSVASLAAAMIGHAAAAAATGATGATRERPAREPGPVVFRAEGLTVRDEHGVNRIRDASFVIRAGEIVGVAAVEGAGHRELLRALAGRLDPATGLLERPAAIGFIPEDRHHDAILLDRTLVENVALRGAGVRKGRIAWSTIRTRTESLMQRYDVRTPSASAAMRALSGGNQQKLVLARELDDDVRPGGPWAIVAENPTRGLDILAAADVHARLRAAGEGGAAVVVYSSDLDEVLSIASRVLVIHAGVLREVAADRVVVGRAMIGLA
jgi:simple sugar transport system ATP-binding protein